MPGVRCGGKGERPAWARLLPELLAPSGYRSYHSGKWHIDGEPLKEGFAHSLRIEGGQNDYFDPVGVTVDGPPLQGSETYYLTTAVGDHAAACLREHAQQYPGAPFFSYIAFTSPHFPLQAPQSLIDKYRARYEAGWDAVQQARYERLVQQGIVAVTALLASVGAAGIPHAGTVMMVIVMQAVGLPTDAVLVILAVDRVLDMGRTTVNVWSDSVGAAIIASFEDTPEDVPPAEAL